jgi:YidC/Oxa1 family membrane protein insertase
MLLSAIVLIGWPMISHYWFPTEEQPTSITLSSSPDASPGNQSSVSLDQSPIAGQQLPAQPQSPPQTQAGQTGQTSPTAAVTSTQEPSRDFTINTDYWTAKISNHGGVITSWILLKERLPDGTLRPMTGADGGQLELIPQEDVASAARPFSVRLPGYDDVADQLNKVNYQITGIDPGQNEIDLGPGDIRKVVLSYSSPQAVIRKTFTFYGGRLVFDAGLDVTVAGSRQLAQVIIGPRIGDQSDKQVGNYSVPPQIVAAQASEKVNRIRTPEITPPFGKVTGVDLDRKKIQIDKDLARDVNQIKLLSSDGKDTLGFARVLSREADGKVLTLDSLPPGVVGGAKVAQGIDTRRESYVWAGAVDHYFAMIAVPDQPIGEITLTDFSVKTGDQAQPYREFPSVGVPVPIGGELHVFVGPKDRHILGQVSQEVGGHVDLEALIDYGTFSFLIRPLAPLVGAAFSLGAKVAHNYGWGIVLVTVMLNLLLLPLRTQSSKKMKNAAKHQPRIKELQDRMKKLKEAPKKNEREIEQLQREQMELMKEANPLGGCLPMLLQMPVFWAIYIYLEVSLDVRHQPWILWIKDLSTADPHKILPVIMCVSMIGSSMLQPQPGAGDPSQKMQRMMMTWMMPIFLTWLFFFSAPSGLVLYWMVSNLAGVGLQFAINKRTQQTTPETVPPQAKKKGELKRKGKVGETETVGGVK